MVINRFALYLGAILSCSSCNGRADRCEAPPENWRAVSRGVPELAIVNRVALKGTELTWNSKHISDQELQKYLRLAAAQPRASFIALIYNDKMDCKEFIRIRKLVDANYPCGKDLCGQVTNAQLQQMGIREPSE